MKFKPTKRKIVVSISISFLIIITLLTLISLSGPNCHRGATGRGEIGIDYFEDCSIFEFAYTIFDSIIIFYTILFLFIYVFYGRFQKNSKENSHS